MSRYFAIEAQKWDQRGLKQTQFCDRLSMTAKIFKFWVVSIFVGVKDLISKVSKCSDGIWSQKKNIQGPQTKVAKNGLISLMGSLIRSAWVDSSLNALRKGQNQASQSMQIVCEQIF